MWGDCSWFHVWYRCEIIIKYNVVLWADMSSGWIVDKCNTSGMKRRVSKINTNFRSQFPFWQFNWTRIVKSTVKKVAWTEHCVIWFHWYIFNVNSIEFRLRCIAFCVNVKTVILSAAAFIANGQNIWSIICGHILMPCNNRTLATCVSCLFLFSTIPFWWCVPTLQNSIVWLRLLQVARKAGSGKLWRTTRWVHLRNKSEVY